MHLAEGVIPLPLLGAGALLAAGGVAVGLRKLDTDRIVPTAVIASTLFVASLIHVPVGPASAHLLLNGLAGLILGWAVFPALAVSLLLQAAFFGYGGLTTLGLNTLNMALPAVLVYGLFGPRLRRTEAKGAFTIGFATGVFATVISCAMLSLSLLTAGREWLVIGKAVFLAHIPLMMIEGLVTASVVAFLQKVRPETFVFWSPANLDLGERHA